VLKGGEVVFAEPLEIPLCNGSQVEWRRSSVYLTVHCGPVYLTVVQTPSLIALRGAEGGTSGDDCRPVYLTVAETTSLIEVSGRRTASVCDIILGQFHFVRITV
jgi:hypothetical protein